MTDETSNKRGIFKKRGEKWSFTLDLGRNEETGNRIQKTVSGFKDKQEAQEACDKMISEQNTANEE